MRAFIVGTIVCVLLAACGCGDGAVTITPNASRSTSPTASTTNTSTPTASAEPTITAATAPAIEPRGFFPIHLGTSLGEVIGEVGSRQLVFDGGRPYAYNYAQDDLISDDPDVANRSGWNCATHYEYEGAPAVDFYVQIGTPIYATMDGTATLNIISANNDFDRYDVEREPYLGNPDRSRASYSPFPGPSSGQGVYVRVENAEFATEYGHLSIVKTLAHLPVDSFVDGYTPYRDYYREFSDVPSPRVITTVARWDVRRGDIIGSSGDSGYSEGPHIHYTVNRIGGPLRCPTEEAGFTDGGWLVN